jgi:hypothetical protein
LAGQLDLGDNVGVSASTITGTNTKFFIERPQYYQASVKPSVPLTYAGINCVGNGTAATSITVGKAVGSDAGRNGWSVVGNSVYTAGIDFDDGNIATNSWYGCSFENLSGTLSWGTATAHNLFSSNFSGCNQFDPVGGIQIRNCNFSTVYDDGVADASTRSALLWNASINIQKCNFLANSHASSDVAHGILHTSVPGVASGTVTTPDATGVTLTDSAASFTSTAAVNDIAYNETDGSYATVTSITDNTHLVCSAGLANGTDNQWDSSDAYSITTPTTYTDLIFSGNEKDVHNSTSPTDVLVISKAGTSNPSTSTGVVVFQGSVTVKVTVKDTGGNLLTDVQTAVYLISDRTEIMNEDTVAGIASTSYAGVTPVDVEVRCRKASSGDTRYKNFSSLQTIQSGTGLDFAVTMVVDTNNNATS